MDRTLPTRRHVPHWEYPGGTVCLTWRLHRDQCPLTGLERDVVLEVLSLSGPEQCELLVAVVMDDHVHVLTRPTEGVAGRDLAQRWKSIASRRLTQAGARRAPIWQAEYFDRWMRTNEHTAACAAYVLNNPVRRWPGAGRYRWLIDRWTPPQAR